jgi:arylsulfatase A-like enzyme
MEAHRPFIPAESYRQRMMSPEQVQRSYEIDRSWVTIWKYCFGLHEYSKDELDVMACTYDACIAELDDLFAALIDGLKANKVLDNTMIILTADHGEHLGEHHMLDHQYTLYQPLIHVPLVVHYPAKFPAGRDKRPVMTFDLFPTILELAKIQPPAGLDSKAVSLLHAKDQRERVSEYPSVFLEPFMAVKAAHPEWDPKPWQRTARALFESGDKYIRWSDGQGELYNLPEDPRELDNRVTKNAPLAQKMAAMLEAFVGKMKLAGPSTQPIPRLPGMPVPTTRPVQRKPAS